MRAAVRSEWKTEPLPERHVTFALDRTYTAQEMERIRAGLVPQEMEEKWFIFWEDETLYFHRSWTGFCVYVVRFAARDRSWAMVEADASRDPDQYLVTDDAYDAKMIAFLVDELLLGVPGEYPSEDPDPGTRALRMWSDIGGQKIVGPEE